MPIVTKICSKPSQGNCGVEMWGFTNYTLTNEEVWTLPRLRMAITKAYLRSNVMFSGNRSQLTSKLGPHALYTFLKKRGEKITASPWLDHYGKGRIRIYFWHPSPKIISQLRQKDTID